jgi:hypothetical protein
MSVDDLLSGATPPLEAAMEGAFVPLSPTHPDGARNGRTDSLAISANTPADQVVNPVGNGSQNAAGKRRVAAAVRQLARRQHSVANGELGHHGSPGPEPEPALSRRQLQREIVRRDQDEFVDAAWTKIGAILDAEMKFNLTRLAIEAQRALKKRTSMPSFPSAGCRLGGRR